MKLGFSEPQRSYSSGSQSARTLTEAWVAQTMYCPNCGNAHLNQFPPNLPVADFFCAKCNDQFELKSRKSKFGKKLANGAYVTKVERLHSDTSPNLILMSYDAGARTVRDIFLVPKRFFVSSIIEKRRPLSPTARRAGWVGSNILLDRIPKSGRISCIREGVVTPKERVLEEWRKTAFLDAQTPEARGWLIEVMNCVDELSASQFSLQDVYDFESYLSRVYPRNKNVRAKIRQQLQVLRDGGYLKFLGNGSYRLNR